MKGMLALEMQKAEEFAAQARDRLSDTINGILDDAERGGFSPTRVRKLPMGIVSHMFIFASFVQ